jgi:hypothetical protein
MTGETYYFIFSLVFMLAAVYFLATLLLLRKGKTMFGVTLKSDTVEFKRGIKLASNRNVAITGAISVILVANLVYDVQRLLRMDEYSLGFLMFLSAFILLILLLVFPLARRQARITYELGKAKKQK